MKKRMISIILSILIISVMMPYSAFADTAISSKDHNKIIKGSVGKITVDVNANEFKKGSTVDVTLKKATSQDKAAAQTAVDEFLEDHEKDPAGTFVYDRFNNVTATVDSIKQIDWNVKEPDKNLTSGAECSSVISFDSSETENNGTFTKTEIVSVDKNGKSEVVDATNFNVIEVEEGDGVLYYATAVTYATGSPDPAEVASQTKGYCSRLTEPNK